MKNLKNRKGITLIALIITIIVMLILVAVTVTVAINGGLFGKADEATTGTEEKAIYDQIVSAMVLKDKGFLNVSSTAKAAIQDLSKEYSVSPAVNEVEDNAEEVTLTVTGKKGTYKYSITEEAIEAIDEEDDDDDDVGWCDIQFKDSTTLSKLTQADWDNIGSCMYLIKK